MAVLYYAFFILFYCFAAVLGRSATYTPAQLASTSGDSTNNGSSGSGDPDVIPLIHVDQLLWRMNPSVSGMQVTGLTSVRQKTTQEG